MGVAEEFVSCDNLLKGRIMAEPITGAEYAAFDKTDAATFFGMRLALTEAVLEIKSNAIEASDANGLKEVKEAIAGAVSNNKYLESAGTQELVESYFNHVIDRQDDPVKSMSAFLEGVSVKSKDMNKMKAIGELQEHRESRKALDSLVKSYGASFLKSANKNLGITTLTEDFRASMTKDSVGKDVAIEPSKMDVKTAEELAGMETTFRRLDAIDAKAYAWLGDRLGNGPAVAHLLAETSAEREVKLAPVIDSALRLKDGTSQNIRADIERIAELSELKNDVPKDISKEQAADIGQGVLNAIVRMRSDAPLTKNGSMAQMLTQADVKKPHAFGAGKIGMQVKNALKDMNIKVEVSESEGHNTPSVPQGVQKQQQR